MARRNMRGRIVLPFLLQVFAICVLAIPLTNPVPFVHNITISQSASQNVTLPGFSFHPLDYPIIGTPLVLRITETGDRFTKAAANKILDRAINGVVAVINKGSGRNPIEHDRFGVLTEDVELRIQSIPDKRFTYFMLGKQVHCGRFIIIHLPNVPLTCSLRNLLVVIAAVRLRFRGPSSKY